MGDVNLFQSHVQAATEGAGGDAKIVQAYVLAATQMPSEEAQTTQAYVDAAVQSDNDTEGVRVTQAYVLAAVRGRIDNRRVRAWTYSLDGNDYYVLRLGDDDTVVLGLSTGQWADWNSPDLTYWRAIHGRNWTTIGGQIVADHGTRANVMALDDTYGIMWLLDPAQGYDEAPRDGSELAFERIVTGGLAARLRQTMRCNEAYLLANKGAYDITIDDPYVKMRTSDDSEKSWTDQGSIAVVDEEWSQEFAWRSLGIIAAPGRIFSIEDNCLARIDTLDIR